MGFSQQWHVLADILRITVKTPLIDRKRNFANDRVNLVRQIIAPIQWVTEIVNIEPTLAEFPYDTHGQQGSLHNGGNSKHRPAF